jgi:hypothetical protein
VAQCRWRVGLSWVSGDPPASGRCFAVVSFCGRRRHPNCYISVALWATITKAEEALGGIDQTGCGGACSGQHEIFIMAPA